MRRELSELAVGGNVEADDEIVAAVGEVSEFAVAGEYGIAAGVGEDAALVIFGAR